MIEQTVHSNSLSALSLKIAPCTLDYVPGVLGPQESNSSIPANEDATASLQIKRRDHIFKVMKWSPLVIPGLAKPSAKSALC